MAGLCEWPSLVFFRDPEFSFGGYLITSFDKNRAQFFPTPESSHVKSTVGIPKNIGSYII